MNNHTHIETFRRIFNCRWPDHQVAAKIDAMRAVVDHLRLGGTIDISESMGSCQCGDIGAYVYLNDDGIPWCESHGKESWQQYTGPAVECPVGYGVGRRAREIAHSYDVLSNPNQTQEL